MQGKSVMIGMLTPDRQDIIEPVAQLTRDKIAPRAAHYDATASRPLESWHDLWKAGFLAMTIPPQYGGLGLDLLTYVGALETLAQGCANTAMSVHMHSTVHRFIDTLATPVQKARYFAETVDPGKIFGSWGSEPSTVHPADRRRLSSRWCQTLLHRAGGASYYTAAGIPWAGVPP
ncbi:hypothetical protein NKDENANG_01319 [Candidatus Entotheonellaceae bacterium PAL068K]